MSCFHCMINQHKSEATSSDMIDLVTCSSSQNYTTTDLGLCDLKYHCKTSCNHEN